MLFLIDAIQTSTKLLEPNNFRTEICEISIIYTVEGFIRIINSEVKMGEI